MNSPIRNNKLLREAYESGRRQGLNEQGMMSAFNVPAGLGGPRGPEVSNLPQTGGPLAPGIDPELQSHIDRLLSLWGTLPMDLPEWMYMYDFNNDGVIDGADLGILLGQQGITA